MKPYETFSTTADVGIRISGPNLRNLFENALKGLNILLFDRLPRVPAHTSIQQKFQLEGDSPENLLVNFLAEILYHLQQYGKVTANVTFRELSEKHLDATLHLAPLTGTPDHDIKSVTYHNLEITTGDDNQLSAEVIFDV